MEELSEYMIKFEKIKRIVHAFKNDLCPKCDHKLGVHYLVGHSPERPTTKKSQYNCKSCGLSFWDNQFYENYFDEIIMVIEE